jgi:hypothetical protein
MITRLIGSILLLLASVRPGVSQSLDFVFPLQKGDSWSYTGYNVLDPLHPFPVSWRVSGDTLMPNGHSYRIVSDPRGPVLFFRQDSSRVYQYLASDSTEFVRYDFSKKPGDTVSVIRPGYFILQAGDQMLGVLGENGSRRVLSFHSTEGSVSDDVVDSIGILTFIPVGTDLWYELSGAIVNGRQYGIVASVDNSPVHLPDGPRLLPNYPNPVNPTTTIEFILTERSPVAVEVSNVLGQIVSTLFDSEAGPGLHRVQWNASEFSSGVYFCVLKVGRVTRVQPMIVLK